MLRNVILYSKTTLNISLHNCFGQNITVLTINNFILNFINEINVYNQCIIIESFSNTNVGQVMILR